MATPLVVYETKLRAIADVCAEPWFGEQLSAFRAGDELAFDGSLAAASPWCWRWPSERGLPTAI
jgi:hypothetical protein